MTKVKELEDKIEDINKRVVAIQSKGGFTSDDCSLPGQLIVEKIQEELHAIDEQWNDGAVKEDDGSIAAGQADLSGFYGFDRSDMLNDTHELSTGLFDYNSCGFTGNIGGGGRRILIDDVGLLSSFMNQIETASQYWQTIIHHLFK